MQNPLTIIIFGATGDLYQNKLSVALFDLYRQGLLPESFSIAGFARRVMSDGDFRKFTSETIVSSKNKTEKNYNPDELNKFLEHVTYVQGDLESLEHFKDLGKKIGEDDANTGFCSNKLFYLAVPPNLYETIFKNIHGAGLTVPCAPGSTEKEIAWTRVLVEKPFGKDLEQAERLDQLLGELFDESQIFRIDHYLAKETVQDILNFRFKNKGFDFIWGKDRIQKVRILFHQSHDVSARGEFYDGLGALRDVGQNHMLQMLALVAMENPESSSPQVIQNKREEVLRKTFLTQKGDVVRGQYEGYLLEPKVSEGSKTETFFRVVLGVDTDRWQGVPFELESGKALDRSEVLIEIYFKDAHARLEFLISSTLGLSYDAYEKVLLDCISGDQTLFTSTKEIMAEWKIITEILDFWQSKPVVIYSKGSAPNKIK